MDIQSEQQKPFYVEKPGQQINVKREDWQTIKTETTRAEDLGRIIDPTAAQEVANLAENKGMDVAVAKEKDMAREARGEMTDFEKRNVELMDGLEKKYPHAFFENVDSKGRKVIVAHGHGQERAFDGWSVVFTKSGVFALDNDDFGKGDVLNDVIDWGKFSDLLEASFVSDRLMWSKGVGETTPRARFDMDTMISGKYADDKRFTEMRINAMNVDLDGDKSMVESVKKMLIAAEAAGLEKEKEMSKPEPKLAADLLEQL